MRLYNYFIRFYSFSKVVLNRSRFVYKDFYIITLKIFKVFAMSVLSWNVSDKIWIAIKYSHFCFLNHILFFSNSLNHGCKCNGKCIKQYFFLVNKPFKERTWITSWYVTLFNNYNRFSSFNLFAEYMKILTPFCKEPTFYSWYRNGLLAFYFELLNF